MEFRSELEFTNVNLEARDTWEKREREREREARETIVKWVITA